MRPTLAAVLLILAGCSKPASEAPKQGSIEITGPATTLSKHPLAKYIELAGFRLTEAKPGQLDVKFIAVNHSEAELPELGLNIRLRTTASKPDDPPVCSFPVKVPSLGPEEMKEVTALTPSKLRVYELPDWQFLRPEFQITEPK